METCPNRAVCLEAATWEEESKCVCLGQEGQANTNRHISRSVFLPSSCNPYKSRREPATHPHTRTTWPTSFGDAAIFPLMPLWLKHLGAGSLSGIHLYTGFQCMEPWLMILCDPPRPICVHVSSLDSSFDQKFGALPHPSPPLVFGLVFSS